MIPFTNDRGLRDFRAPARLMPPARRLHRWPWPPLVAFVLGLLVGYLLYGILR